MTIARISILTAVLGLLVFAGWRNVGQWQAERLAQTRPESALAWRPHDPSGLQVLAERQLAANQATAAQATVRRLLAHEPLNGVAYRIMAEAAARQGQGEQALAFYQIAARRAARDLPARAWLAQHYLAQGDYPQALEQIDTILRLDSRRSPGIHRALVQLAQDQDFAAALADALRRDPPWRGGVLAALQDPQSGNPGAAGQVMQSLQNQGGLSGQEYAAWLDNLIAQGRWGEAYARWASIVPKPGGQLPLIFNGGFEHPPSDTGFDWRLRKVPGVLVSFEEGGGVQGAAAHIQFLGRRVGSAGLEQAMILSPGRYQLVLRQRASGLRSGLGLQWQLACAGSGALVGRSPPVDGAFEWRPLEVEITVPAQDCPAQWLRLVNPVAGGAAQQVSGSLWVDDVKVRPLP